MNLKAILRLFNHWEDIDRKTVLETDGVSIDRFKERVEELYDEYFSRWDVDSQYPENGRGIENPWRKEVGVVLSRFYEKEKKRVSLEKAREYEKQAR